MFVEIINSDTPFREPTNTAKKAKTRVTESGLFVPEEFIPIDGTEVKKDASGKLFSVGRDLDGEFFYIKPSNSSLKRVILHNRFRERQDLGVSTTQIPEFTIGRIDRAKNHVYTPNKIDPRHRESQETTRELWSLFDHVLEDGRRGHFFPYHFLEVGLGNIGGSSLGEVDAIGITSVGNIWAIEHGLDISAGGKSKYNQIRKLRTRFIEVFEIPPIQQVGAVCLITSELSADLLFTKIAYANPKTTSIV